MKTATNLIMTASVPTEIRTEHSRALSLPQSARLSARLNICIRLLKQFIEVFS
jgi:hypothetical protein